MPKPQRPETISVEPNRNINQNAFIHFLFFFRLAVVFFFPDFTAVTHAKVGRWRRRRW